MKVVKFSLHETEDLPLLVVLDSMKKHEKSVWIRTALWFFLLVHKKALRKGVVTSDIEEAIKFVSGTTDFSDSQLIKKKEELERIIDELVEVLNTLNLLASVNKVKN